MLGCCVTTDTQECALPGPGLCLWGAQGEGGVMLLDLCQLYLRIEGESLGDVLGESGAQLNTYSGAEASIDSIME